MALRLVSASAESGYPMYQLRVSSTAVCGSLEIGCARVSHQRPTARLWGVAGVEIGRKRCVICVHFLASRWDMP